MGAWNMEVAGEGWQSGGLDPELSFKGHPWHAGCSWGRGQEEGSLWLSPSTPLLPALSVCVSHQNRSPDVGYS